MPDRKQIVLIVEDDLDVADMLNAYFRVQGYEVLTVDWGEDAIQTVQHTLPDLIILDIRLPDIDGYEVAARIRENRRTAGVPIIFLTEQRQRTDRLRGLELGADDYITKPFDIQELRLRVRNSLRRTTQGPLSNPITNLSDGAIVDERLKELLEGEPENWALMVVSIKNLEVFRESYGFVASDDVLRAISVMVAKSVRDRGGTEDFLGHLGVSDFVIVTRPDHVEPLQEHLGTRLDQSIEYFYPVKDRENLASVQGRLDIRLGVLSGGEMADLADLDSLKTALVRKIG
jgi:DNA-binding response OmpR family regulator